MRIAETIVVSWLIGSCLEGCVDLYHPDIDDTQQSIIIYGTLTDNEGYYYVHVSRTVQYKSTDNVPIEDCDVEVIDDNNKVIQFYESEPGLYEQWIDQEYLKTGKKYKLRVTADGTVYESGYETMLPCPPVGNVYYEIEKKETSDPENDIYGIQFYTDLVAPAGYPKSYRWELEETWEYHSEYLIRDWWDGSVFHERPFGTDSLFFCWSTKSVPEIYAATTNSIPGNSLSRIPLRFVSNETNRLKVAYSLLIRQYSLSDTAYYYWSQLKKQNEETGGLYETQPAQIHGNISNINDDSETVLGFFNVSGMSENRIFVTESFHFFPADNHCKPVPPPIFLYSQPSPLYFVNVFIKVNDSWTETTMTAPDDCFDCTLLGGTIEKPDFWELLNK